MGDLVKCRLQVNKEKYKNLGSGFKITVAEQGAKGLFLGWAPTMIGYSAQGLCKFGFYEVFADIALSPMESVKVRMQTSAVGTFPTTLRGGFPAILKAEGINGFYKALVPLWGRQIPYTMMKFACFEKTVEAPLRQCCAQTQSRVHQGRTAHRHLRCWLHCRCVLCHRLPPCRHHCVLPEQGPGSWYWRRCQGPRLQGDVGWSGTKDHHDRYPHCSSMVHL